MTTLDNEISKTADQIVDGGKYISAVCENIANGDMIKCDDGSVITYPINMADEIIKAAHQIKETAIKYQALIDKHTLIDLDNKKAITGVKFGD